jgi:predicted MFS family arabinose efflux permease
MIYLLGFLMDFSVTTALLAFNFRAVDLKSSPMELGILGGTYSACYSLSCFLMAKRFASIKERMALSLSAILIAIVIVVGLWIRSVWALVILAGLAGIVASHFWPPLEHWLGRLASSAVLYRVLGSFSIWWCAGMSLGTALCGLLYRWHFRVPLLTSCFCLLLIAAVVQVVSKRSQQRPPNYSTADRIAHPEPRQAKTPFLRYARISIFLTYAAAGCIFALFPKLGQELVMSKPAVSRILFFLFFGQLTSFLFLGRSRWWQYNFLPLLGIHALSAVAFLFLFLFESPGIFAAAFAVIGFAAGLSFLSSLFYTLHEPRDKRGAFAGIHESLLSGGRVIGPLVAGFVANFSTLKHPYLFLYFVFACSTVFILHRFQRSRPR